MPGPHGRALRAGPHLRGELPAKPPAALRRGVQLLHLPRARPRRVPPRRARGQVRRVHFGGAWAEPHLLDFVTDPANSRSERKKQVSMEAGRLIGELHALLQAQYIDLESEESQKALNILCVRLVFCLFCEDAELFPKDALLNYLRNVEPKNMRVALKRLFKALDTPIEKRAPLRQVGQALPLRQRGFSRRNPRSPTSPTR